ncbi:uncharacterized protein LOC121635704 [Melanotaenia boesemani]|uniref:uncharacterized protein LOC121635704 n=1 Tax=Melanotaenia boesemani TaxID=1250792 RepID=UPI001C04F9DC|nr:uncharacterized protein LOC121635704 [Melanotaenia boesemani]
MKVGKSVTVQCSVFHTCSTNPPALSLNIPLKDAKIQHTDMNYGTKTTLTTTFIIQRDRQTVECSVRHHGGRTAKYSKPLDAKCSFSPLIISPASNEFLEGIASQVTCTASYMCAQYKPVLTWNYEDMPASTHTTKVPLNGVTSWKTVSTLTLTLSAKDHGKALRCYAQFTEGNLQQTSITLRVKRNMHSLGWSISTPRSITGLRGSCIVIPCTFSYTITSPHGLQIIWYLYQSSGYPVVFNPEKKNVVSEFSGITSMIGAVANNNCSLKIDNLKTSHNEDRLYPWIDKNPIDHYHSQGHSFYDKTTQLMVEDEAQKPQLSITGIPRVGKQSKLSCSVQHTCISNPPTLSLNGVLGSDHLMDTLVSDGIWERTIERTWNVAEEDKSVKCTVSHPGGQTAFTDLTLDVECPYEDIKMVKPPGETTEGIAQSVICSVSYKCKKNTPTIVWNYGDMQSSLNSKTTSMNTYTTESNLTFIGSLNDDGKPLTCTAQFISGETSDSTTLHVKKYEKPAEVEPSKDENFQVLAADVPFSFSALSRSCVVIPCSFQDHNLEPMTRGIWSNKNGDIVFHNGRSSVMDHFKDRTRLLGDLMERNCSLEIDDIKPFDNGPFCFGAERGDDQYRFNNSCVFIIMKASPDKPEMSSVPAEVDAGSSVTVSCSVSHTCPSHPPEFSWSVPNISSEVSDTLLSRGVWQRTSTITFVVAGGDGAQSLTCTAIFWREKQQASTAMLTVKGTGMFQFRNSAPVVFPVTLLGIIFIVLAAAFGLHIHRKRKNTGDALRPPPRPEKRRSLWDRMSRRYPHGDEQKPPRPEKRRSIWNRISRSDDGRAGWQNMSSFWRRFSRHHDNRADLTVSYLNNTNTVISNRGELNQPHLRWFVSVDGCSVPPPSSRDADFSWISSQGRPTIIWWQRLEKGTGRKFTMGDKHTPPACVSYVVKV